MNFVELPYIIALGRLDPDAQDGKNRGKGSEERQQGMGRIIKAVFFLAVLGFIALTGYAYVADLRPDQAEVKLPVTLDAD